MQIKTTLRFHLTPVRMTKIKNSSDSKLLVELQTDTTTLILSLVFQKVRKIDIVLPENTAITLLGIYPKDAPTCNKDTCSTNFISAIFIIDRS